MNGIRKNPIYLINQIQRKVNNKCILHLITVAFHCKNIITFIHMRLKFGHEKREEKEHYYTSRILKVVE